LREAPALAPATPCFAESVKIGVTGINVPIPAPMAFHSFGGW
jgi:hypothetical protein